MLWLILGVFILMLLCIYLEDESRQIDKQINTLVKQAKLKEQTHTSTSRPWLG